MRSTQARTTRLLVLGAVVLAVVLAVPGLAELYTDLLWFRSLGQAEVFGTVLWARVLLGLATGGVFFALLYTNVRIALRLAPRPPHPLLGDATALERGIGRAPERLLLPAAALAAFVAAVTGAPAWDEWLQFTNGGSFGLRDPVFQRDASFYVFRLPLYETATSFALWTTVLALAASLACYLWRGAIVLARRPPWVGRRPRIHLSILVALLFLVLAVDAWLDGARLVYSQVGPVAGASWADVHARLPALRALLGVSVLCAVLVVVSAFRRRFVLAAVAVVLYVGVAILGVGVYPAMVHRFGVVPNELGREARYIRNNIEATRAAYGLDRVSERQLSGDSELGPADIAENRDTIENIRLWDHEPLLSTFAQIQEIRTYYDFVSVDNDRYRIEGKLRQTMLSPRELSVESLPNRTWINERLTFTHGYGLTLGPVNEATPEGLPVLFVKDIPPISSVPSLRVARPAIYFGERASDHAFVKSRVREFDHPAGEANVYSEYRGRDGIPIGSAFSRLAMSIRLWSAQLLFSGEIDADSRVLLYRNVRERVERLAPFVALDADPYMVIRDDGTLVWILDGYTTTDRYPNSEPTGSLNYIRNSVKAVVDAYDGSVNLYVVDDRDPLLRAWRRIFPDLFAPIREMPADIRAHLRYPEGIFRIQSHVFTTYHMGSADLLYNREDQWEVPTIQRGGVGDGEGATMEPYYTIMKLPGEREAEFILMLPLTPKGKDNLAAWMAVRMDGDRLGEIVVYRAPKDRLVYGPQQIVNRINQDPEISRQISLWDQRGSRAILGTLLVIPIEESLVYVQPLYLQSEGGRIPELKRVIVVYENRIAMTPSLEESMTTIFGGAEPGVPVAEAPSAAPPPAAPAPEAPVAPAAAPAAPATSLAAQAREHYERAVAAQRRGDWGAYGEELTRLGDLLERMAPRAAAPPP